MNKNLLNRHNKIIKVFTYHNTMVVNDFTYFIAVTHRHLRCKDMKNNPNIQEIFQKNISSAHSRGTQATLPLPISQKKKMEAAELLLITSDETIKNVAMKLGYYDCSYFKKTFKKYSGITPQQYRDGHKGGISHSDLDCAAHPEGGSDCG